MSIPSYNYTASTTFSASTNYFRYDFISSGPKGHIPAAVAFQLILNQEGYPLYNLALGTITTTNTMDDTFVINNNDTEEILTTVAKTLIEFTEEHPLSIISLFGNTKARTRLYQMKISKYFDEISKKHTIYGQKDSKWQIFQRGINYDGFMVFRKTTNE